MRDTQNQFTMVKQFPVPQFIRRSKGLIRRVDCELNLDSKPVFAGKLNIKTTVYETKLQDYVNWLLTALELCKQSFQKLDLRPSVPDSQEIVPMDVREISFVYYSSFYHRCRASPSHPMDEWYSLDAMISDCARICQIENYTESFYVPPLDDEAEIDREMREDPSSWMLELGLRPG